MIVFVGVVVVLLVFLVIVGLILRALGTRINGSGLVDPSGSDAARQWDDMKQRQEASTSFWSGFFP